MTGGSRIVAIGTGAQDDAPPAVVSNPAVEAAENWEQSWEGDGAAEDSRRSKAWIAPLAALLLIAAWTGLFAWTNRATILSGASLDQWVGWIAQWSAPVLVICVAWLMALRNSTREAARFGDAARLLADESARLETRLVSVNRELSLAREFIAAQSRDIDSLGRVATERLSQHAERLASLIQDNGTRIDTIGSVSTNALDNMERLRGQLPVIASSAKDVTNHIGNAGRTAQAQLQDMVNGFTRLNEFGQASERQVIALRERIDQALGEFSRQTAQLDDHVTMRFTTLREGGEALRAELDGHEVAALAAIRGRSAALLEELATARDTLDGHEAESLSSLRARLGTIRDESGALTRAVRDGESQALDSWQEAVTRLETGLREAVGRVDAIDAAAVQSARQRIADLAAEATEVHARLVEREDEVAAAGEKRRRETEELEDTLVQRLRDQMLRLDEEIDLRRTQQSDQSRLLASHSEAIANRLGVMAQQMLDLSAQGETAKNDLADAVAALADRLGASRDALSGTGRAIADLTDGSVRLLELIQASATHSQVDLPAAIAVGEDRLAALEARASAVSHHVERASDNGKALSDYVIASQDNLSASLGELERLHGAIAEHASAHGQTLAEIQSALVAIRGENEVLAEQAQGELRAAIETLSGSAREAVTGIETTSATQIAALAERLGDESGAAIERALRLRTAESVGQLEQAAAHAAGVSREAAIQLRDQLSKVNELAGNLERRVAQARERAEEQVDNDFARRVALISEALNSNAIDIARTLDTDVSDTAWASYLKGDRGVFTRRAVKLLEPAEAKLVAQIYENDGNFREHVSHYIHDFEAMLRQLLSTRDGHALGVTLLSSDMGKLYVALAQAIERLRN